MARWIDPGSVDHTRHARDLNVLLGAWLFVSAFAWPHSFDVQMVTCIVGVLVALSGAAAFVADELRYVEAMLGGLLVLAAIVQPNLGVATCVNNVLVGAAVSSLALLHDGVSSRLLHRLARHH
ncbi:MAG TPA: hypothetical protein VGI39_31815 [Polyangiaceae bacterium]|jgi:hypothetical protein